MKYISQNGNLTQTGVKIKNILQPPPRFVFWALKTLNPGHCLKTWVSSDSERFRVKHGLYIFNLFKIFPIYYPNIAMGMATCSIGNISSIRVHFPASYVSLPKRHLFNTFPINSPRFTDMFYPYFPIFDPTNSHINQWTFSKLPFINISQKKDWGSQQTSTARIQQVQFCHFLSSLKRSDRRGELNKKSPKALKKNNTTVKSKVFETIKQTNLNLYKSLWTLFFNKKV